MLSRFDKLRISWLVAGLACRFSLGSDVTVLAKSRYTDIETYSRLGNVTIPVALTHLYRWRFAGMFIFLLLTLGCIAGALSFAMANQTLIAILFGFTPSVGQQTASRFSKD